jgi:hypothetical protein
VSANEGYRLASIQWKNETADKTYESYANIAKDTFTANQTITVQTEDQVTLTILAEGGGMVKTSTGNVTETSMAVDKGASYSGISLPDIDYDKNQCTFNGWYVRPAGGDGSTDTKVTSGTEVTFSSATTLVAKFTAKTYAVTLNPGTGTTITNITGVKDSEGNAIKEAAAKTSGFATYDTDIEFQVEVTNGYVLSGVANTIGGVNQGTMTADNGTYTIEGSKITGAVIIDTSANAYYTVTFEAGDGTELSRSEKLTAYVWNGGSTLYASLDSLKKGGESDFTVPTVSAQANYRLAEKTGEYLWVNGSTGYTADTVKTSLNATGSVTLTAHAIRTYTVTFSAGEHGSLAEGAAESVTVDTGTAKSSVTKPEITASGGYALDAWTWSVNGDTITSDITATATYKDGTYTITFPTVSNVTFTTKAGVRTGGSVTHGTAVQFTKTVGTGKNVTAVSYSVSGGDATELTPDVNGVYTIPGDDIKGNIAILITANDTVQVTYLTDGNGTVTVTSKSYDLNHVLTKDDIDKIGVTANPGYEFVMWTHNEMKVTDSEGSSTLVGQKLTGDITYKAVFQDASYTVTYGDQSTGTATHGTDLTFKATKTGEIIIGVTYTVGGAETKYDATNNGDGTYTIPGSAITGAITISYDTIAGSFEYVTFDEYDAMAFHEKLAILKMSQLKGKTLQLEGSTHSFYWSGKYQGYVIFVDEQETDQTLAAKLAQVDGDATAIDYSGDINGDGSVNSVDGGMVMDIVRNVMTPGNLNYTVDDVMRLKLDVDGNKTVSVADARWIVEEYLNLHTNNNG